MELQEREYSVGDNGRNGGSNGLLSSRDFEHSWRREETRKRGKWSGSNDERIHDLFLLDRPKTVQPITPLRGRILTRSYFYHLHINASTRAYYPRLLIRSVPERNRRKTWNDRPSNRRPLEIRSTLKEIKMKRISANIRCEMSGSCIYIYIYRIVQ